jgi:hypothetical protein
VLLKKKYNMILQKPIFLTPGNYKLLNYYLLGLNYYYPRRVVRSGTRTREAPDNYRGKANSRFFILAKPERPGFDFAYGKSCPDQ